MNSRRVGVGAVLLVLAGGLAWWALRGEPAEEAPSAQAGAEAPPQAGAEAASLLLSRPVAAPRGALQIRGRVTGPEGPVRGAVVVATTPEQDDALSERPCGCGDCQLKLLECGCEHAVEVLVELVARREGEAQPMARTVTDAEGRYVLDGLEQAHFTVWADAPRLGSAVLPNVAAGAADADLRVEPGLTLAGKAVDEEDRPVAGAQITAVLAEHARTFEARAGPHGEFTLAALPAGRYALIANAPGLLPGHADAKPGRPAKVTLAAPHRLAGVVTHEGKPQPGLQVALRSPHRTVSAKTDAAGRFTFEGVRAGEYTAQASRDSLIATAEVEVPHEGDLALELSAGAFIEASVVDDADAPVASAKLSVLPGGPTTTTGAAGASRLGPLPPGHYRLQASAKGHRDAEGAEFELQAGAPATARLTLPRAALVSGVVVGPDGQPAGKVKLYALRHGESGGDEPEAAGSSGSATSEADGTFTVDGLAPGAFDLRAESEEFLPSVQEVKAPSSGVRVALRAGLTVRGRVLDEQEHPVPQASVRASPARAQPGDETTTTRSADADDQGAFRLSGLAPGTYSMIFSAPRAAASDGASHLPRVGQTRLEVSSSRDDVVLRFEAGLTLRGKVVDPQGQPVAGAMVLARPAERALDDDQTYASMGSAETQADGSFAIEHLRAIKHRLWVHKRGYVSARDLPSAIPGDEGLTITISAAATAHGRVVHEDGTPFAAFTVNRRPVKEPSGEFTESRERDGKLDLSLEADGVAPRVLSVQFTLGKTTELGDVVLGAGRTVTGRVVSGADRQPVANALVVRDVLRGRFDPESLGRNHRSEPSAHTDAQGRFTLPNASVDAFTLSVYAEGFAPSSAQVPAEQSEVQIALPQAAQLEGRVLDASGKPLSGMVILAGDTTHDYARIDVQGAYHFSGLAPGKVVLNLELELDGERGNAGLAPKEVTLVAGQTQRADFREAAGAALTVAVPNAPRSVLYSLVAGVAQTPTTQESFSALWLRSTGGPGQGSYTFKGLSPGRYTVVLFVIGSGNARVHTQPVTIGDQDAAVTVPLPANLPQFYLPNSPD